MDRASDFETDEVSENSVYGEFFRLFSRWSQLANLNRDQGFRNRIMRDD